MWKRLDRPTASGGESSGLAARTGRMTTLVAVVCGVGLLAAGCGSSKSSSGTAGTASKPALTKAQFLAQGNAICEEGSRKLAVAQKELEKTVGSAAPTEAQVTAYATSAFVPSIQGQIEKIRALGGPAGEEATVGHMLDVAQSALNEVKTKPALLLSGHPFAGFAKLAHPYGLTACAKHA
jgi:hypothetical protein